MSHVDTSEKDKLFFRYFYFPTNLGLKYSYDFLKFRSKVPYGTIAVVCNTVEIIPAKHMYSYVPLRVVL